MSDTDSKEPADIQVDARNLYREDVITDLRAASIRRLIPIKSDGADDPARPAMYIGETSVMTQMGPLPVQFPIEARGLEEALKKFPEAVKEALEQLTERAKEMRREQASRIVVPTAVPPDLKGGVPGTGVPGPGKIILGR
jgi:hypothetical protein